MARDIHGAVDEAMTRWFGSSRMSYRAVLGLLGPVVVSQAFATGFWAFTPMLVSKAGVEAISAVSTVDYLNIVWMSVFLALGTAGSVLVAHRLGGGDAPGVRRAVAGTIWAVALPAAVVGASMIAFQGPLLGTLLGGAGPRVLALGHTYLMGAALSYPAYALVEGASAVLRGLAHTRPALALTVTSNGGFLLLATILVRGANLGVTGLAVSLIAARWATVGLAWWVLRHDGLLAGGGGVRVWPFDARLTGRILLLGIPFVAEQLLFNGGKLVIQFFVVGLGVAQMTVNAIGGALVNLAEMVPWAMAVALVPVIGQAVGAGDYADARRLLKSFLGASVVAAIVTSLLLLAAFTPLIGLYHLPAALVGQIKLVFLIAAAGRVCGLWTLAYVLPGGLRAAGDTVFTTVVAGVCMAYRVSFSWLIGVYWGYGIVGIWAVMTSEWVLRGIAFAVRFHGRHWERRAFLAPPPVRKAPSDAAPVSLASDAVA